MRNIAPYPTASLVRRTDSYKVTHASQYPPGTEYVESYFESRGGAFTAIPFNGLLPILVKHFQQSVTKEDVAEAAERWAKHFGTERLFNYAGWMYIVDVLGGNLPLSIRALPEGTVIEPLQAMMVVRNTDPKCWWLTNWAETVLTHVWYPCTVAAISRDIKQLIYEYLVATGTPDLLPFKLHDFGFRGASCVEQAGIGGCAHLLNFQGTDTSEGFEYARHYYGEPMAGFSIPASEHSTITSWGKEYEVDAYRNMIEQFGGYGLYACVSDSYDIYNACSALWGSQLQAEVLDAPGTLVVRPDSGDPPTVVLRVLEILGSAFGYTVNEKGYKVLNPTVRVIQGDGINRQSIDAILRTLTTHLWSTDNIAFGMGAALLQDCTRDTCKFAFKCSSVTVNGQDHDVWKDPVTDPGKVSKRGRLRVIRNQAGRFETVRANEWREGTDELIEVYRNGEILVHPSFVAMRGRARLDAT